MHRKQPNPRYRVSNDLNQRDREHHEVAASIQGDFTAGQHKARYRARFPQRNESSIIPSDYCFDRDNRGNSGYPRFLIWDGEKRYEFIDLDGVGSRVDNAVGPQPTGAATPKEQPRSSPAKPGLRGRSRGRLFLPENGVSQRLRRDEAERAIRAYNSDPDVLGQERRAFAALGTGFRRGYVVDQLRALDAAYSTRSVGSDLQVIGDTIEREWESWSDFLQLALSLDEEVIALERLRSLLEPFLGSSTRRKPRSLATKALHFGSPTALKLRRR